ncbi:MAG TPA: glycerophosphodiester phosphodiesterase [Candidatus Dormibacteraeota bacterium]|jgi:glycerophosphoryl diester phosphodiesterase|nr:glycerophosphodiester phosphodiesterase [Candidatus Dormibacteraeota bacterium]
MSQSVVVSGGRRPIGFAHRGGALTRREQNTIPAFRRAVEMGAGVESDVLLTADGVPVLLHAPLGLHRGRPIRRLHRAQLPSSVPTLNELYTERGTGFPLALDMTDPGAAAAVVDVARRHGALDNLWMTYWRLDRMARWRERWPSVHLVYASMVVRSPDRFMARLAAAGVDAVNVHHRTVSRRLVASAEAHSRLVFAWGVRGRASVGSVLARGAHGVFADDVEALVAALQSAHAVVPSRP